MDISAVFRFAHSLPADSQVVMDCYHTWGLVALAYALACIAAVTTLSVIDRVIGSDNLESRHGWGLLGGISMGTGIWSMHFVAMKAFQAPIPIAFDLGVTGLSLLFPIVFCYLGLTLFGRRRTIARTLVASLLIGTGIVLMHYVGMSAMRMPAELYYELSWFVVSVFIAVSASFVALLIAQFIASLREAPPWFAKLLCSLVMGGAIAGMHFSSMAGTVLVLSDAPQASSGFALTSSTELSVAAAVAGFLIMAMSKAFTEVADYF